jgi:5-methylcytosine-specific restriction protein A
MLTRCLGCRVLIDGGSRCRLCKNARQRGGSVRNWRAIRQAVYERDGGRCVACKQFVPPDAFVCDHMQPLRYGGTDDLDNLRTLCVPCNKREGV